MFRELRIFRVSACMAAGVLSTLALPGCEAQSTGFALPPGDARLGQVAFTELGCNQCHRITNVVERVADSPYPAIDVRLGGPVSRIKTYGELVTSIMHPTASLSRGDTPSTVDASGASTMRNYNDQMTVAQLVNLAAFLQPTYTVWVPEHRPYIAPPQQ